MDAYIYTPVQTFLLKYGCSEPLQITAEKCCSTVISMGLAAFPRKIPNSRVSFVHALSYAPTELADFYRVRFFSQETPYFSRYLSFGNPAPSCRHRVFPNCFGLAVFGFSLSLSILYHIFYAMSIVFHIKYYTSFVQNFYERYILTNPCKSCTIK